MDNLEDALLWADIAAEQRFQGLCNTEELRETVLEMFNGSARTIVVDHIQGTSTDFKCRLLSDAMTCEDVNSILVAFERNTFVTMKRSKYL